MPSYYTIRADSLGKLAHHSGMADVHSALASHYYDETHNPDSRSQNFNDAALRHHRSELSYNQNQLSDYGAGRKFRATVPGDEAKPENDTELLLRYRKHSPVYTDGKLLSKINQQSQEKSSLWREQGHEEDMRNSGKHISNFEIGKRFI